MKLNLAEFKNIDPNDIGKWPIPVKAVAILLLCVALLGAGFWFDTRNQLDVLAAAHNKESELKELFK